jgi:hypothetical protein
MQGAGSELTSILGSSRVYARNSDGLPPVNMKVESLTLVYSGGSGYIFVPSTGSIPFPATPTIQGFTFNDVAFTGSHQGNTGVSGTYMDLTGSADVIFDNISVDLIGQYGYNPNTGEGGGFFIFVEGGTGLRILNSDFHEDGYSSSVIILYANDYLVENNQFIGSGLIKQDDGANPQFNPRGERVYNASGSFIGNTFSQGSFYDYFYNSTDLAANLEYTNILSGNTFNLIQGGFGVMIRSDANDQVVQQKLSIDGNHFNNGIAIRSELTSISELVFGANTVNGVAFEHLRVGGNNNDVVGDPASGSLSNWLSGGPGNDELRGSSNAFDAFNFWAELDATTNVDTIVNFENDTTDSLPDDKIWLDDNEFRFLNFDAQGILQADSLSVSGSASQAQAQIIYDPTQRLLSYDPDGTGVESAIAFAQFQQTPPVDLSADDIMVF